MVRCNIDFTFLLGDLFLQRNDQDPFYANVLYQHDTDNV